MSFLKVFAMCFVSIFIITDAAEDLPIKACKKDDLKCLGEAAIGFVMHTADGLPAYDCKAVDPMTLDTMQFESPGVKVTLSNIKLSGMKGLKLTGFRLDEVAKRTDFNMTLNLDIAQDISMEFTDPKKTVSGRQTGKMNVACMIGYPWDVVKDATGEHYAIGPDTITCDTITPPELTMNPEMITELQNDAQINKNWETNKDVILENRRKNVGKVAARAFSVVIGNFRNAAKKLMVADFIVA